MPPLFTARIRHSSFTLSPFQPEDMIVLGNAMIEIKKKRLASAVNSEDAPAKPLTQKYAARKAKGVQISRGYHRYNIPPGNPIRNWNWRGKTLGSFKVKSASEDRVVIGFVDDASDRIITAQRRITEMLSDSPNDKAQFREALRALLATRKVFTRKRAA